jgi:hypothetical protein
MVYGRFIGGINPHKYKMNNTITTARHENLTDGSRIRVACIPYGEVTVCTLKAYAAKYDETVEEWEVLDRKFGRETTHAWGMQHAGVISADYPGKAEAHAKKWAEIAAAPLVNTGDILVVDGVEYAAKVMGNYSDAVQLKRINA